MATRVHPSALVDAGAELADDVTVGPYAVIGPHVRVQAGTTIGAHCVLDGHTRIGCDNRIHSHAAIGTAPQDKKYDGEPTRLEIGNRNTFREFVTVNTGTVQDGGVTRVADDNWIMAYVHIAHDCQIGSQTVIANAVQLGGHVHVGDWAVLGGLSGIHQFTRVGAHAMLGFSSRLAQDLPPFMTAAGNPAAAAGINAEGLRRRGWSAERIALVKRMHRALYREGLSLQDAQRAIEALRGTLEDGEADIAAMLAFVQGAARGIVR